MIGGKRVNLWAKLRVSAYSDESGSDVVKYPKEIENGRIYFDLFVFS